MTMQNLRAACSLRRLPTRSLTRSLTPTLTRSRALIAACAFAFTNVAFNAPLPAQSAIATLTVDGRASANPSIAAQGAFVAVAFSAATVSSMDIFVATSRDGGTSFGAPVQVNRVPGEARVSGEEPPRVVLVPRPGSTPDIVVVWTAKAGANWKLLSARSTDGGTSFSTSRAVPGSEGDGARGWQSVAVDAKGRVLVLWLDHRDLVKADSAHKHTMSATAAPMTMPKGDPTERAALSQLFFSSLDNTTAPSTATANANATATAVRITRSVCYCCKTTLAASGNSVYAVWRHVYPGSQRDIAFSKSSDGGRTFAAPQRVSDDHWQIDGCPDNGPALAIDTQRRAHVVWPTPADGKDMAALALFYAVSRDGAPFSARTRIPTRGAASHPQVVITADGSALVAWDEVVDGTRRMGMTRVRVDAAGRPTFTPVPAPDAGPKQWYPALASSETGALTAWVRQLDKGSVIGVARVK